MPAVQSSFNRIAMTTEELSRQSTRLTTIVIILMIAAVFLGAGLGGWLRDYQLTHAPSPLVTLQGQLYKLEKVE